MKEVMGPRVRMRMKKKETHRKKNIEWNRQIKELSFQ
jgi:hypothetical protein